MSDVTQNSQTVNVRYEQTAITHTTQFVLSGNAEEVVIDCSSGPIPGDGGEQVLPIHSRHALPWSAVRRLSDSLRQLIDQYDRQHGPTTPDFARQQAGLPSIGDAHVS